MEPSLQSPDRWFRRQPRHTEPRLHLICFPHAGGTPSFFHSWASQLPEWIEVVSVHYPGRETRRAEPLIANMTHLVPPLCAALVPILDRPFAMFGHSLGAAVVHEVARRLEGLHLISERLYVSGRRAPMFERASSRHLYDDDRLWSDVCRLGGMPPPLQTDTDVRSILLPILRNDYRLSETYRPTRLSPLRCPVTAIVGDEDSEASSAHVAGWRDVSGPGFVLRVMRGGHFYLVPRCTELLRVIVEGLRTINPELTARDRC